MSKTMYVCKNDKLDQYLKFKKKDNKYEITLVDLNKATIFEEKIDIKAHIFFMLTQIENVKELELFYTNYLMNEESKHTLKGIATLNDLKIKKVIRKKT